MEARSLTGGEFYYGDRLTELRSAFVYGDWMTGKIWGLKHNGKDIVYHQELVDSPLQIVCFFIDPDKELVIVSYDGTLIVSCETTSMASPLTFRAA